MMEGAIRGFFRHSRHALGDTQMNIILELQVTACGVWKQGYDLFDKREPFKADIDPLRKISHKAGGIFLFRLERKKEAAMLWQPGHPGPHPPADQILLKKIQKIVGDLTHFATHCST